MGQAKDNPLTDLITAAASGDGSSVEQLIAHVYDELRALADRMMRREPRDHTLQPTALVHEAYLRLVDPDDLRWNDRRHFFAAAAQAMRRILVDRARRHRRLRHGGDRMRVQLDSKIVKDGDTPPDHILLDQCLTELEDRNPEHAQIVVLRYYAGLGVEEIAELLGISPRTVKRRWRFARAWLYDRMSEHDEPD